MTLDKMGGYFRGGVLCSITKSRSESLSKLYTHSSSSLIKAIISSTDLFFCDYANDSDSTQLHFTAFINLSSIITVHKKTLMHIITAVKNTNYVNILPPKINLTIFQKHRLVYPLFSFISRDLLMTQND